MHTKLCHDHVHSSLKFKLKLELDWRDRPLFKHGHGVAHMQRAACWGQGCNGLPHVDQVLRGWCEVKMDRGGRQWIHTIYPLSS